MTRDPAADPAPQPHDGAIRNPRGISLWTGEVCDHCGMTWGFCCDCDTYLGPRPEATP